MCNGPTYRYSVDIDGTFTTVTPVVGDDVAIVTRKVEGQEFYREEVSGDIVFLRDDYDLIAGTSIEKKIGFNWEKLNADGNWDTYFHGYFTKADCSFELDECNRGICRVTPDPEDNYDNILSGLDKEFNLIELAPPITPITYKKQPLIQMYTNNGSYLMNVLDGHRWEEPVPTPINNDGSNPLINDYKFGSATIFYFIPGSGELTPDVSGTYDNANRERISDGKYKLTFIDVGGQAQWQIIDLDAANAVVYEGVVGEDIDSDNAWDEGTTLTSIVDPTSQCHVYAPNIFVRLLTNDETVGGSPTSDIPANDIISTAFGYEKVIGITDGGFTAHDGHSETATQYGTFASDSLHFAGEYFTPPTVPGETVYPVFKTEWQEYSLWFNYDSALRTIQETGTEIITVRDCYKLADALDSVLDALDISIRHADTSTYSDFLYGSSNPIRGTVKVPMIAPKSNVVIGDYDQPAQKAPITLSELTELLWVALRCKWHINSQGQFIVEHISYYENGGTYSGTTVGSDLTTLTDPQTGKNWGWAADRWTYEKEDMPERFEFGWMDDVSAPFEGFPIQVRSEFVQKGRIEKEQVSRFTSDIDYIQAQSEDIAKDGFCFFEATESGGVYSLPFVDITLPDGTEYKLQNGYAAFVYLHPNYHRYGLPASLITLNEEDTTALSITRRKIQELGFPLISLADPINLITTGLGTGKVLEIEENVNGEYVKVRIAHDTT